MLEPNGQQVMPQNVDSFITQFQENLQHDTSNFYIDDLMSCIFWFVQTLIIGVGSFEVNFVIVFVRLTLVRRYCVSTKLHQTQKSKIILNLQEWAGGFFYLVTGLSLVAPHILLTTLFLHLSTVRISIFAKQTTANSIIYTV